jgi:hypothetical protein
MPEVLLYSQCQPTLYDANENDSHTEFYSRFGSSMEQEADEVPAAIAILHSLFLLWKAE